LVNKTLENLNEQTVSIVADLYSNPHLTTKLIKEIVKNITNKLLDLLFNCLIELITLIINNETDKNNLQNVFKMCSKAFVNIQTEYLFLKTLNERSLYIEPIKFKIDRRTSSVIKRVKLL